MKNLILIIIAFCLCSFCFGQFDAEVFQTSQNVAQYNNDTSWNGEMLEVPSVFSSSELFNFNELDKLKDKKIAAIVLSFSDFAQVSSFDQKGLNAERVRKLSQEMAKRGISTKTKWSHIGLPCNDRVDAQSKYHGFYIYYKEIERDFSIDGLFPKAYSEKYSAFWKALGLKKEIQTITVENGGTLTFSNGHELKLPPNCLVDKNGNSITGKADITFFAAEGRGSLAALGLSTTSNNQLLVTDGSYHIGANQNGDELQIKEGSAIQATFAESSVDTSMKLFAGEFKEGKLDWIDPQKMSFGEVELKDNTRDTLRYTASYIRVPMQDNISGRATLSTVEEHRILNELLNNTPEDEFVAKAEALSFVKKILSFSTPDTLVVFETLESYNRKLQAEQDSLSAERQREWAEQNKERAAKYKKQMELRNYITNVTQVGWKNCDRFNNDRTAVAMNLGATIANANEFEFVNISMIFKNRNMIVAGFRADENVENMYITKSKSGYTRLPKGDKVLLLATAEKDGQLYYFTKHFIIKGDAMHTMTLKPIGKIQFKNILKTYNKEV